ncbi:hypothetical protein J3A83DRAFT_4093666, partial [Scleroderma citrinum]
KDKSNMLYHEANVLYWAKALLKMTYEFIDHTIDSAKELPPFRISHLCFNCGGTVQSVKSSSMISTMYLAEELITISLDGDFVKYIHNSDAVPCNLLGPEVNSIEQFLAFMQHVQYVKTSGQVYISDYQGIFTLTLDSWC